MKKGLIHIYTGDGKGKTTASIGLSVRALGHGFKVAYASFFKKPDSYGYNEISVLRQLGATVFTFSEGMPMANPQISKEEYHASTQQGLTELQKFITTNNTQLLVLDEILIAIKYGYISEEELFEFMDNKPVGTELVLTGRGATNAIKSRADYISVLAKEKHPYEKGVNARIGIEF
jgi:cob(I)alamin adenosyltransferase